MHKSGNMEDRICIEWQCCFTKFCSVFLICFLSSIIGDTVWPSRFLFLSRLILNAMNTICSSIHIPIFFGQIVAKVRQSCLAEHSRHVLMCHLTGLAYGIFLARFVREVATHSKDHFALMLFFLADSQHWWGSEGLENYLNSWDFIWTKTQTLNPLWFYISQVNVSPALILFPLVSSWLFVPWKKLNS